MLGLGLNCKMENIQIVQDGNQIEHVIIDRGNNEFTSMLKSTYDEMIAKQQELQP